MLSRWRKEYREGKIVIDKHKKIASLNKDKTWLNKLKELESEVARLKRENELLKKWQRFFAQTHQHTKNVSEEAES